MIFIKYREMWAHGYTLWQYDMIDEDYLLGYSEALNEKYAWSDKYRRCEVEKIDSPPREWLIRKIDQLQQTVKDTQELIVLLTKSMSRD